MSYASSPEGRSSSGVSFMTRPHAGWSERSFSSPDAMNSPSSRVFGNKRIFAPSPRKPCHSSPSSSSHGGAHSVRPIRPPTVSVIGTMVASAVLLVMRCSSRAGCLVRDADRARTVGRDAEAARAAAGRESTRQARNPAAREARREVGREAGGEIGREAAGRSRPGGTALAAAAAGAGTDRLAVTDLPRAALLLHVEQYVAGLVLGVDDGGQNRRGVTLLGRLADLVALVRRGGRIDVALEGFA